MARMTVTFTLDSEHDAEVVQWLDAQPKRGRSEAIREALTYHVQGSREICLADVYHIVSDVQRTVAELERKVRSGAIVTDSDAEPDEVSPELAEAYRNLGALAEMGG